MSEVTIRGTTDPEEVAVVLALLCRDRAGHPPKRRGISAWRDQRRAALATEAQGRRR